MARLDIEGATPAPMMLEKPPGTLLADVLRREVPLFLLPCGGRGTCGKCLIWVRGALDAPGAHETALLGRINQTAPPRAGYAPRLACFCRMLGDAQVILPSGGAIAMPGAHRFPLPAYDGGCPGLLGAACDIGTTTVSMALYHLGSGALLATANQMNRQGSFGADVLSRIEYAIRHGAGAPAGALRTQLAGMLAGLLQEAGAGHGEVERVVLTGNTTMLHFAAGLDPRGIGVAPFTPASLFGTDIPAGSVFPRLGKAAGLYLPTCVSAYVGADITCGLLACGLLKDGKTRLLVDVGTNGEMSLAYGGRLLCCATAAGPAFEGAQISMGMPATAGAVYRVSMGGGQIVCETIGDAPAVGICGTGLISAVHGLLQAGALDGTGRLLAEGHPYEAAIARPPDGLSIRLAEGVFLTQKDIRAVQLAKAAIAAGIETMLREAGIPAEEVEELLLAGGFGSYIDPAEAAGIGLIPPALAGRATAVGNAALGGAAAMLFSTSARREGARTAAKARELPLSTSPVFMDAYMEQMSFPGE